ncbi:hypothetical protein G6F24_017658 [Rhizopus arrhizus]|nr:hypothetical protein G6F24_017658 [Rhizopus arrhizus]
MKAVKRFDPERGVRLVSFAVDWIKAEIHEYIIRIWRLHAPRWPDAGPGTGRSHRARTERAPRRRERNGSAPVRPRHVAGKPGRRRR